MPDFTDGSASVYDVLYYYDDEGQDYETYADQCTYEEAKKEAQEFVKRNPSYTVWVSGPHVVYTATIAEPKVKTQVIVS